MRRGRKGRLYSSCRPALSPVAGTAPSPAPPPCASASVAASSRPSRRHRARAHAAAARAAPPSTPRRRARPPSRPPSRPLRFAGGGAGRDGRCAGLAAARRVRAMPLSAASARRGDEAAAHRPLGSPSPWSSGVVGRSGHPPGVRWAPGGGRGWAARPLSPRCRRGTEGGGERRSCGTDLTSGPERAAAGLTRQWEVGGGGHGSRRPAVAVAVGAGPSQRDAVLSARWGTAAAASSALPCGEPRSGGGRRCAAPAAVPQPLLLRPRGSGCSAWVWLHIGWLGGAERK